MPTGYVSSVLDAPATDVWSVVRDFNGLPKWMSMVVNSEIEDGRLPDQIGCVRNFTLEDGGRFREQLLEFREDGPMWFSYRILECPLPVENYVSMFRCFPVTDGDRAFVDWAVTFDCVDASENEHYRNFFERDVYMVGIDAIRDRVES